MNAGLSNLEKLKKHLLAGALVSDPKFDAVIAAIGLGVAGVFDSFCNRKLGWQADAEIIFSGNREHYVLPRYPVASIASVETRQTWLEAWVPVAGEPVGQYLLAGMIQFAGTIGSVSSQVRVVWSGGYWFETSEPDDADYPSVKPAGAVELPGDLQAAFLLQCEQAWQVHDRLGTGIIGGDGGQFLNTRLSTLDLVPLVKTILQGHVRYQLS